VYVKKKKVFHKSVFVPAAFQEMMSPPVSPSEQTMWKLCPAVTLVLTVRLVVATRCVN